MKKFLVLVLLAFVTSAGFSQGMVTKKVAIQTNGVCAECKKIMMEFVPQANGVIGCGYDMNTSKITISYDANRTNPDNLRKFISLLGFDADGVKADAAARAKLPACCRAPKYPEHHCGGCSHGGNSSGSCSGSCGGNSSSGCGHNH